MIKILLVLPLVITLLIDHKARLQQEYCVLEGSWVAVEGEPEVDGRITCLALRNCCINLRSFREKGRQY